MTVHDRHEGFAWLHDLAKGKLGEPSRARYHARPAGRDSRDSTCGAVAQLGERCVRNAEVEGSIPFRSTI
jgi:hypothetical protein